MVPLAPALLLFFLPPFCSSRRAAPAEPPAPEPDPGGSVLLVGGGVLPDTVRDRFLELAGGKQARIVVIPTASAKADGVQVPKSYAYWKAQNAASVVLLNARRREDADDPIFVQPLREATGVWLGGGDQSRLTAVYRGTAVERELRNLVLRGGVVGGTSAGAAVMSAVMITGGNPLAQVGQGFDLLSGVVVDQHFSERNRLTRLLNVLARYPTHLGLGIDEETAVLVRGHTLTVLGNEQVRLCRYETGERPASVRVLRPGERLDLLDLGGAAFAHPLALLTSGRAGIGNTVHPGR
jgi:cyanophycinase